MSYSSNYDDDLNMPLDEPSEHKNEIYYGTDDITIYISVKNNKKWIWKNLNIKYKNNIDEYYKQFPNYSKPVIDTSFITDNIDELKAELLKINVKLLYFKWSKDAMGKFYKERVKEKIIEYLDTHKENLILFFENDIYSASLNKKNTLYPTYSIDQNIKEKFNKIFCKYFANRTLGFVRSSDPIEIHMAEKKNISKGYDKIYYDINIIFNDKKINENSDNFIKKLNKLINKKIGFPSEYDKWITRGKIHIIFAINTKKQKEFLVLIDKLKLDKDIKKIGILKY